MVPEMEQATRERVRKMEPGTVRQAPDSIHGRTALAVLLLPFLFLVCFVFSGGLSAAGDRDVLQESGIRYPDGYDSNTVGEVQGSAYTLYIPSKGPVSFDLKTKWENYRIVVSPSWYWHDLDIRLNDGQDVRVVGSKSLGKDGRLYIIAQEIESSGRTVSFRAKDGTALWKGGLRSGSGGGSGWGSASKGRGEIGGAYGGGAGRGRR